MKVRKEEARHLTGGGCVQNSKVSTTINSSAELYKYFNIPNLGDRVKKKIKHLKMSIEKWEENQYSTYKSS